MVQCLRLCRFQCRGVRLIPGQEVDPTCVAAKETKIYNRSSGVTNSMKILKIAYVKKKKKQTLENFKLLSMFPSVAWDILIPYTKKGISCSFEIQTELGVLYFYLLVLWQL